MWHLPAVAKKTKQHFNSKILSSIAANVWHAAAGDVCTGHAAQPPTRLELARLRRRGRHVADGAGHLGAGNFASRERGATANPQADTLQAEILRV
jgi:hypothetical protein